MHAIAPPPLLLILLLPGCVLRVIVVFIVTHFWCFEVVLVILFVFCLFFFVCFFPLLFFFTNWICSIWQQLIIWREQTCQVIFIRAGSITTSDFFCFLWWFRAQICQFSKPQVVRRQGVWGEGWPACGGWGYPYGLPIWIRSSISGPAVELRLVGLDHGVLHAAHWVVSGLQCHLNTSFCWMDGGREGGVLAYVGTEKQELW